VECQYGNGSCSTSRSLPSRFDNQIIRPGTLRWKTIRLPSGYGALDLEVENISAVDVCPEAQIGPAQIDIYLPREGERSPRVEMAG
jgi:hypothetical protein